MKYKLIKTYPGSPELNTILDFTNTENIKYSYNYFNCKSHAYLMYGYIDIADVVNNPEYWQEVVERNYEILSFIGGKLSPRPGQIAYRQVNGNYTMSKITNIDSLCNEDIMLMLKLHYNIHSIKRLSDGEIFTVGDKVDFKGYRIQNDILTKITIAPYTPFDLRLWASYTRDYVLAYSIDRLSHKKQPLFKTEDGVEIFDLYKDSFYYVRFTKSDYHNPLWEILVVDQSLDFKYEPNVEKYFSTKQAAEEYVIMNKPCLSINDVAKVYTTANQVNSSYPHAGKIRNLVKQKLGL